jgi:[protein-PII] uridylyltransferase
MSAMTPKFCKPRRGCQLAAGNALETIGHYNDRMVAELTSLAGRARAEQARVCRAFLDQEHARIVAAHQAGAPGDQTARAYAEAADEVVRALFRAALAALDKKIEVAVVAVGGYGRAELCPYSDLDLWFLVQSADARAKELAESVLYPLWDLKLEVGHAVRTVDGALGLAREDLTAATALLDTRFLDGSAELYAKLEREVPRLFDRDPNGFVRRLAQEKQERHARFGDTVFLLEPNLKNGEGGYRDLLTGLWAVKARFHVRDFPELVTAGQASPRQTQALVEARRFYLTLRVAAHLSTGRKADRLTFETQEAVAPSLVGKVVPKKSSVSVDGQEVAPAVAPAVEALMQRYFVAAKAVKRETDRLLERCVVEARKKPTVRNLDHAFALFNGKLTTQDPDTFRQRPSELMRIFNVALETGAEIYGHTRDLIADAVAQLGPRLAEDREAGAQLLKLLCDDRDTRAPSLLEQAHDLGLLAAIMPEFEPCTGRVQHDLYHVFTVDQHQLYAVARLKALQRGELAQELPTATQAIREVQRRAPLYLGTLLHDVGKPLGKGHSDTGARLAQAIGPRLGLSAEDVSQTEFLVRKHLLLSHLSQRRDLNDAAMIANLASELNDGESLRELYCLTVADMSMVAPGNLTEWKEQLLSELYSRTLTHFTQTAPDDDAQVGERRRARVAELMAVPASELGEWFATVGERYLTLTSPKQIARHVALTRRRNGPVSVEVVHRTRKGVSELSVCADDAPGLLAKIAGVLLANRVDVLEAQIHSRSLPGGRTEALDVFVTRDRYGRPITDEKRWLRVEEDLRRVLSGAISAEALVEERRERSSLKERVVPQVRTEIEVDHQISTDLTVIDVYTQDRPGVLYTITRTLAGLRLDIQLSKVATEASRVADVFYVREQSAGKLTPERADEVILALSEALGRLQTS